VARTHPPHPTLFGHELLPEPTRTGQTELHEKLHREVDRILITQALEHLPRLADWAETRSKPRNSWESPE
jgi:hypothetical protein